MKDYIVNILIIVAFIMGLANIGLLIHNTLTQNPVITTETWQWDRLSQRWFITTSQGERFYQEPEYGATYTPPWGKSVRVIDMKDHWGAVTKTIQPLNP